MGCAISKSTYAEGVVRHAQATVCDPTLSAQHLGKSFEKPQVVKGWSGVVSRLRAQHTTLCENYDKEVATQHATLCEDYDNNVVVLNNDNVRLDKAKQTKKEEFKYQALRNASRKKILTFDKDEGGRSRKPTHVEAGSTSGSWSTSKPSNTEEGGGWSRNFNTDEAREPLASAMDQPNNESPRDCMTVSMEQLSRDLRRRAVRSSHEGGGAQKTGESSCPRLERTRSKSLSPGRAHRAISSFERRQRVGRYSDDETSNGKNDCPSVLLLTKLLRRRKTPDGTAGGSAQLINQTLLASRR